MGKTVTVVTIFTISNGVLLSLSTIWQAYNKHSDLLFASMALFLCRRLLAQQ